MDTKKASPKLEIIEKLIMFLKQEDVKPGDKLPSERELCAMWNVNRSTLRSALKEMQERGLIDSIPGMGSFVRKPKFQRNLKDLRPLSVLALEQNYEIETLVLQQKVIHADDSLSRKLQIRLGDPVLELIRLRYLDGEPAFIEYSCIDLKYAEGLENEDFTSHSLYQTLSEKYKLHPSGGRQRISITYLNQNESILFQIPEGTPALYLSGVTYVEGCPHPVEAFKSIIRSDRVSFSCNLIMIERKKENEDLRNW